VCYYGFGGGGVASSAPAPLKIAENHKKALAKTTLVL